MPLTSTDFREEVYSCLETGSPIKVTDDGKVIFEPEGIVAASDGWIKMDHEDFFEDDDLDFPENGYGWEFVDFDRSMKFYGAVTMEFIPPEMVNHIMSNPGVYQIIAMEGVHDEWLSGTDHHFGWALVIKTP